MGVFPDEEPPLRPPRFSGDGRKPLTAASAWRHSPRRDLEPYANHDVVGRYTATPGGAASVTKKVTDNLDEIHSVSVWLAGDFTLEACAAVNQ